MSLFSFAILLFFILGVYMNKSLFIERLIVSIFGLFLMSLGISFAIRSNLGITPISCPPYVLSHYFTNWTLGQLTVGMHITMIIAQVIILRKEFPKYQYSQIFVSFLFGFLIDGSMWLTQSVTAPNYAVQILYVLLGSLLVSIGIIFEVTPKLLYLAGDGLMITVARVLKRPFGQIKIGFDVTLVTFSIIAGYLLLHQIVGVREGTLISAILVGFIIGKLNPVISPFITRFLERHEKHKDAVQVYNIITIGRELGSGGRETGQKLAKKLGWKFIDREFIKGAVVKSGLSGDFVEHNDQQMTSSEKLLRYISMDNIFNDENLSDNDRLFIAQSKIIKDAAEKGNCVIVGRCADVVLDDCDNCFNIVIAADKEFAKKRVAEEFKLTEDEAVEYINKINHLRSNHYNYYTGRTWGDPSRYDMYIKSSSLGIDKAVEAVYNAVKQGK